MVEGTLGWIHKDTEGNLYQESLETGLMQQHPVQFMNFITYLCSDQSVSVNVVGVSPD